MVHRGDDRSAISLGLDLIHAYSPIQLKYRLCDKITRDTTHLRLPRLEIRHLQNDLIWCYKILFGHAKICSKDFVSLMFKPVCHVTFHLLNRSSILYVL